MARIFNVRLFKIDSTHNNLRTPVVEGQTMELPTINSGFLMFGQGLKFGSRLIQTTEVTALSRLDTSILFKTKNSTYTLLIDGEYDDEFDAGVKGKKE